MSIENEQRVDKAIKLFADGQNGKCEFYAPILSKYEIGNSVWKRSLDIPRSKLLIEVLFSTPINFIDLDEEMAKRAIEIALGQNVTFYDASFIALAENLGADLVSDNPKHHKPGLSAKVKIIPLGDYR